MGRPRKEKKEIPYDEEVVKEYITRLFNIEKELRVLRLDKKDLRDEFKGKIDFKLLSGVVRLVKAKLKLSASEETIQEISDIVKDKIGSLVD